MAKKKPDTFNFVTLPDLKCSYFLVDNKKNPKEDTINLLIRLEEGRHKGVIVEVSHFDLAQNSNALTFSYDIVYNPLSKLPNKKTVELFIRNAVGRIVTNALTLALNEVIDEDRVSDSEVAAT